MHLSFPNTDNVNVAFFVCLFLVLHKLEWQIRANQTTHF